MTGVDGGEIASGIAKEGFSISNTLPEESSGWILLTLKPCLDYCVVQRRRR